MDSFNFAFALALEKLFAYRKGDGAIGIEGSIYGADPTNNGNR